MPPPPLPATGHARRQLLQGAALLATAAAGWPPARAHGGAGPVDPPLPAPALALTLDDGRRSSLPALLQGRVTALQLMFTGCTATCPIQGALFASVQAGLPPATPARPQPLPTAQLLSVSIDALGDEPRALARWLRQHSAGRQWRAAVPSVAGVEALFDFLGGRNAQPDRHTAQVYLFGSRGQLLLRSADFPSPPQVLGWLAQATRLG